MNNRFVVIERMVATIILMLAIGFGSYFLWDYEPLPRGCSESSGVASQSAGAEDSRECRDGAYWRSILKELRDHYNGNNFRTVGFLLLVIGWLITSSDARDFLSSNFLIRYGVLIAVAAFAVHHSYVIHSVRTQMAGALVNVEERLVVDREIYGFGMAIDGTVHLVLFVATYVFVLSTGRVNREPASKSTNSDP